MLFHRKATRQLCLLGCSKDVAKLKREKREEEVGADRTVAKHELNAVWRVERTRAGEWERRERERGKERKREKGGWEGRIASALDPPYQKPTRASVLDHTSCSFVLSGCSNEEVIWRLSVRQR